MRHTIENKARNCDESLLHINVIGRKGWLGVVAEKESFL